jgi:hypothetical protein
MPAPDNYSNMNYATLTQQIIDYANRGGVILDPQFVSTIPYFIFQAQQRIWREAKDIGFETVTAQGDFIVNNAIVPKPPLWNKTISFIYGSTIDAFDSCNILYLRTYEFCRAYWPNANLGVLGNPPLFYSDHRPILQEGDAYSSYFISPTPDQAYKYQITYLVRPDIITADNQENILTRRFPDVLFYAGILEAMSYLKDDERIPVFESMYNRALQSMNLQTQERYSDRTSKIDKD